jgi:hypothetical protein
MDKEITVGENYLIHFLPGISWLIKSFPRVPFISEGRYPRLWSKVRFFQRGMEYPVLSSTLGKRIKN